MNRITSIEIENVRLDLNGLTVIVGENGVGKSTLVECCEMLRRVGLGTIGNDLHRIFRLRSMVRDSRDPIRLAVTQSVSSVGNEIEPLRYDIAFASNGAIESECLLRVRDLAKFLVRDTQRFAWHLDGDASGEFFAEIDRNEVALRSHSNPALDRSGRAKAIHRALETIEVQIPLDTTPSWASSALARVNPVREESSLAPVDRVGVLGCDLASAWHELKNDFGDAHWNETMEIVRLGLGDSIESVSSRAGVGGGSVALWLKYKGRDAQIPATGLSDGTLAWLSLVAIYRLRKKRMPSLLVIDEIERHFHPRLLGQAFNLCESMSIDHPVILTTHSDRLLDMLEHPEEEVVLMDLDERTQSTRLLRPDPTMLAKWRERYSGYGSIRAEGYEFTLYEKPEP